MPMDVEWRDPGCDISSANDGNKVRRQWAIAADLRPALDRCEPRCGRSRRAFIHVPRGTPRWELLLKYTASLDAMQARSCMPTSGQMDKPIGSLAGRAEDRRPGAPGAINARDAR